MTGFVSTLLADPVGSLSMAAFPSIGEIAGDLGILKSVMFWEEAAATDPLEEQIFLLSRRADSLSPEDVRRELGCLATGLAQLRGTAPALYGRLQWKTQEALAARDELLARFAPSREVMDRVRRAIGSDRGLDEDRLPRVRELMGRVFRVYGGDPHFQNAYGRYKGTEESLGDPDEKIYQLSFVKELIEWGIKFDAQGRIRPWSLLDVRERWLAFKRGLEASPPSGEDADSRMTPQIHAALLAEVDRKIGIVDELSQATASQAPQPGH